MKTITDYAEYAYSSFCSDCRKSDNDSYCTGDCNSYLLMSFLAVDMIMRGDY